MKALEFENVSYRYPGEDFDIIDGLSFAVEPGSFHCIVGVSGCGKSTILRMTCGLLKPRSGRILVNGAPIDGQSHYCGYMPQRDLLFPWRTVGENLALPLEIRGGYTKAERRELAESALEDVGLAGCADKLPGELSGGMRQRAAFARTMLAGSGLLLLDEPFSALDFLTRVSMQEWLLDQWERHKKTILFITHDVEEAVFLSGSVLAVAETPIRRLAEIPVPAPCPRTRACLTRPDTVALREELIEMLREQVKP
nr:ABC transporter ATP-binding protein [uncultured Oscillibacter sp.]